MDTGLVSFVLPALGKDWALAPAQLGWIVSIAFVGMALGAVFSGWLADRFGRKTVFAGTMVVYSIATGLCALAPDLTVLLVCRFLSASAWAANCPLPCHWSANMRRRKYAAVFIVLLESFWGLGWLSAALVSYFFIPQTGWHSAFLFGALPLFYVPLVLKFVPESVPYLLSRGKTNEAHHLVSALEIQSGITPPTEAVAAPAAPRERIRFVQLWQHPFARRTLMLWLVWFGIVFSYYGIFTWLPKLLVEQGNTVVKTFEYVLVMIVAQLPGYIAAAALVERIGRKATLAGFLAACAVCAWFFGQSTTAAEVMILGQPDVLLQLGRMGRFVHLHPRTLPLALPCLRIRLGRRPLAASAAYLHPW